MFAVEIDQELIEKSESGSITGSIWLQTDDVAFPEQGWNDFVVVILGWWTNEAAALVAGTKKRGELMFMDGPMSVAISAEGDRWKLECNRRRRNGTTLEHRATVDVSDVAAALVRAADIVLERCEVENWKSSDIEELQRGRAALAHAAGANLKNFIDPRL
jgi:hypothetical protein